MTVLTVAVGPDSSTDSSNGGSNDSKTIVQSVLAGIVVMLVPVSSVQS